MAIMQDSTHPTGVSGDGSGLTPARMRKAEAALALRQKHTGWTEIAEALGYPTPRHALIAVEKALQAGLQTEESKEFMRMLASKKFEELIFSVWGKATDTEHPEHLTAVGKARELLMDHAKMNGYLAPQELAIYNPLESEIERVVGLVVKQDVPEIEGGDIFEMEAGDDGVYEQIPSIEDF